MRTWLLRCLLAVLVGMGGTAHAQQPLFFRVAGAASGGIYFPVANVIAQAISSPPGSRPCDRGGACGVPGLIGIAQSSDGSVANVTAIQAGQVDSGLSQADVAYWAFNGTGVFQGQPKKDKLRAIANLFPEHLHVVARGGAQIASIAELRGKSVSIGLPASGAITGARIVLRAANLDEKRNFKPLFLNIADSVAALKDGRADALITVAGYPNPAVAELATTIGATLVPISGSLRERIRASNPFYMADAIPAETYKGMGGEVQTLAVGALWLTSATLPDGLVYEITKALWHPSNRRVLDSGPEKARSIRLPKAVDGVSIPFHPGAERYYREVGLLK